MDHYVIDQITERREPPTRNAIEQSRQQQLQAIRDFRKLVSEVLMVKN